VPLFECSATSKAEQTLLALFHTLCVIDSIAWKIIHLKFSLLMSSHRCVISTAMLLEKKFV